MNRRDGFVNRLLMEQQVKTVDRINPYRHQHHCNKPRRRQRRGARRRTCGRRRRKRSIRYPKQNGLQWNSKVKQWIELASSAITLIVTGQEDD